MEQEIICITLKRIDIPEEVLALFMANCICSEEMMTDDIYEQEWDEEIVEEVLGLFNEEYVIVQNEIVVRLEEETDIPGEYLLAMLYLINGSYRFDKEIAMFCTLAISLYKSEDVEQAIVDVVSAFGE
jgi:hypothetical protein